MSNEDKMRGEFDAWWPTQANVPNVIWKTIAYEAWKACAASKDAEIKQWQRIIDEENKDHIEQQAAKDAEIANLIQVITLSGIEREKHVKEIEKITAYVKTMETQRHAFRDALDVAENEITSRDLMIKELRNALLHIISNTTPDGIGQRNMWNAAQEALTKTEHHDSRALEKMLAGG